MDRSIKWSMNWWIGRFTDGSIDVFIDGSMDWSMDWSIDGLMDGSINALMDGWIDWWMDGWIDRSMDRSIEWLMDGWINGLVNGLMDDSIDGLINVSMDWWMNGSIDLCIDRSIHQSIHPSIREIFRGEGEIQVGEVSLCSDGRYGYEWSYTYRGNMYIHIIFFRKYSRLYPCMQASRIIMYSLYLFHNPCFEFFYLCGCWSGFYLGQSSVLIPSSVRGEEAMQIGCFPNLLEW